MKTINERLKTVRDIFLTVTDNTYHYTKPSKSKAQSYIVWIEKYSGNSLDLDNNAEYKPIIGDVDIYTKDEYSELIDKMETALNDHFISYSLASIQYEESTGFIHYEFEWEI